MTNEQVEELILNEIRKRDITYYDMKGLPNCGVDIHPEDKITPLSEKGIRRNRFTTYLGCDRMRELLSVGKYNPYRDEAPLKIPFQDLFRFWWNRCVEQDLVVDEILEDIFDYLTSLMAPPAKEEEKMDMTLDFDRIPLLTPDARLAA
jgi:hypothetical protein